MPSPPFGGEPGSAQYGTVQTVFEGAAGLTPTGNERRSSRRCVLPGSWPPGLPGLYSRDWPTPIGGTGEASFERAQQAVGRGGFELVTLSTDALLAVRKRFRRLPPDEAAIAEEIASLYSRSQTRAVERHMERLFREANLYEYAHIGSEAVTGRKPPSAEARLTRRIRIRFPIFAGLKILFQACEAPQGQR